jgi:ferritin
MISKKVVKLINEQIAMEDASSQIYLAMATWADSNAFRGTAAFMYKQAEEERGHMHKFIHFLSEVGEHAHVAGIPEPAASFKDIEQIFETALKHEKKVTASINNIYEVAVESKDYAAASFLKWFIDEQVEEEAAVREILDVIKMAGKVSIYLADKEIGARISGK